MPIFSTMYPTRVTELATSDSRATTEAKGMQLHFGWSSTLTIQPATISPPNISKADTEMANSATCSISPHTQLFANHAKMSTGFADGGQHDLPPRAGVIVPANDHQRMIVSRLNDYVPKDLSFATTFSNAEGETSRCPSKSSSLLELTRHSVAADGLSTFSAMQQHQSITNTSMGHSLFSFQPRSFDVSNVKDSSTEARTKRTRLDTGSHDALHYACAEPIANEQQILDLLNEVPSAASTPATTYEFKLVYNPQTFVMEKKQARCPYTYPLNIAIVNGASSSVVQALLDAAPQVISMWDGPNRETALHLILRMSPRDLASVDSLLLKTPHVASTVNAKHETPLHVACRSGVTGEVVRHLVILYPEALTQRNAYQQTPLQVAQGSLELDSKVLDYLMEQESETYIS